MGRWIEIIGVDIMNQELRFPTPTHMGPHQDLREMFQGEDVNIEGIISPQEQLVRE